MPCKTKYINFEDNHCSIATLLKQYLREDVLIFISANAFEKFKNEENLTRPKNQEEKESFFFQNKFFGGDEEACFIAFMFGELPDSKEVYLLKEYWSEKKKVEGGKDTVYYKYNNQKQYFEVIVIGGNEIPKYDINLLKR